MRFILSYLFIIIFSMVGYSQSLFDKGYFDGFAKGYCHQKPFGCIPKVPIRAPLPTINEKVQSYQDGYNRGFAAGIDYRRYEDGSQNQSGGRVHKQAPVFGEYISPVNLELLQYVLQKLEEQRLAGAYNNQILTDVNPRENINGSIIKNSFLKKFELTRYRISNQLKPLNSNYALQLENQLNDRIKYFEKKNWILSREEYNDQISALSNLDLYVIELIETLQLNQEGSKEGLNSVSTVSPKEVRKRKQDPIFQDFGTEYWSLTTLKALIEEIDFKPSIKRKKKSDFIDYLESLSSIHFDAINESTAKNCLSDSDFYYQKWCKKYGNLEKKVWDVSCKGFIIIMLLEERRV